MLHRFLKSFFMSPEDGLGGGDIPATTDQGAMSGDQGITTPEPTSADPGVQPAPPTQPNKLFGIWDTPDAMKDDYVKEYQAREAREKELAELKNDPVIGPILRQREMQTQQPQESSIQQDISRARAIMRDAYAKGNVALAQEAEAAIYQLQHKANEELVRQQVGQMFQQLSYPQQVAQAVRSNPDLQDLHDFAEPIGNLKAQFNLPDNIIVGLFRGLLNEGARRSRPGRPQGQRPQDDYVEGAMGFGGVGRGETREQADKNIKEAREFAKQMFNRTQ